MGPMSAADVFDRAVVVYRRHFARLSLIAGIVALPVFAAGQVLNHFASPALDLFGSATEPDLAFAPQTVLGLLAVGVAAGLVFALAYGLQYSALVVAAAHALHGERVGVGSAYRAAARMLGRFVLLGVLLVVASGAALGAGTVLIIQITAVLLSVVLPEALAVTVVIVISSLVLIGGGAAVTAVAVFAPQALLLENCRPFDAMKRSWELVIGSGWRVLSAILLAMLLIPTLQVLVTLSAAFIVTELTLPLLGWPGASGEIITNAISACLSIIVMPYVVMVLTLCYYDARVRSEAADILKAIERLPASGAGLTRV